MKYSEIPTDYIMLKADTNSDYDSCHFAIIRITKEWQEKLSKRIALAIQFKDEDCFSSLTYYDSAPDFYQFPADDDWETFCGSTEKDWCYINIEEEELETLTVPEDRLDCYRIAISKYGTVCYKAYGKYSGDEFYTVEFSTAAFISIDTATTFVNH